MGDSARGPQKGKYDGCGNGMLLRLHRLVCVCVCMSESAVFREEERGQIDPEVRKDSIA